MDNAKQIRPPATDTERLARARCDTSVPVVDVRIADATRRAFAIPASVRATVLSRLAYAYAGAGRTNEFDRARMSALETLTSRQPGGEPDWMYYLTPNHLDCQAGYSLIHMGRQQIAAGDPAKGRTMLRGGAALLRGGAYDRPLEDPSQRRALYEGAWLALGCAALGKLEDACRAGRLVLPRL